MDSEPTPEAAAAAAAPAAMPPAPAASAPPPDTTAAAAAAAAEPEKEEGGGESEGLGLLLDAAIYEHPAERLRNYQQTALTKAREGNLVMCGASGIGKTHVALALLREADYSDGKLAFFLTTTRNLAEQQCRRMRRSTSLSTRLCVGMEVDMWSKDKWQALFRQHRVIVCTAQVLVNLLQKGSQYITMSHINVLILDECHKARRNHPYTKVMCHYDRADPEKGRPRVFGMTATPSKYTPSILRSPAHLCPMDEVRVFAAKAPLRVILYEEDDRVKAARTARGGIAEVVVLASSPTPPPMDVDGAAADASSSGEQQQRQLQLYRGGSGDSWSEQLGGSKGDLIEGLVQELHTHLPSVAKAGNLDADTLRMSYDYVGPWFGLRHVQLVLEHWGSTAAPYDSTERDAEESLMAGKLALYLCKALKEAVARGGVRCNDRIAKLLACLEERRAGDGDGFRAIVFVQRRITCRVLYEYLNLLPSFAGAAGFAIGQSTAAGVSAHGLTRRQRRPVQDFGAGKLQVLVATDVLSEGIDVPECSLVVGFDEVPNATAFVQMRGRARQHDGGAFVLFAPDTDTLHRIFSLEVAAGRFEEELLAEEEAIMHPGDHSMSRLFPQYTYLVAATGALINLDNAMPFLHQVCVWNRECQSYRLSPIIEVYEETDPALADAADEQSQAAQSHAGLPTHYRCVLSLPAVFDVPPVHTPRFRSKRVARAVAALLACREFHLRGIVDDDLNPVREAVQLETYDHFIPEFAGLQATNEKVPIQIKPDMHLGLKRLTHAPPPPPPAPVESLAPSAEPPASAEPGAEPKSSSDGSTSKPPPATPVKPPAAEPRSDSGNATSNSNGGTGGDGADAMDVVVVVKQAEGAAVGAEASSSGNGKATEEKEKASGDASPAPIPTPPLEMVLEAKATQEVYIYLLGAEEPTPPTTTAAAPAKEGEVVEEETEVEKQAPPEPEPQVLGVLTTVPLPAAALAAEGLPPSAVQTLRMTGAQLELLARFQAVLLHFVLHGPASFQTELAEFLKVERAPREVKDKDKGKKAPSGKEEAGEEKKEDGDAGGGDKGSSGNGGANGTAGDGHAASTEAPAAAAAEAPSEDAMVVQEADEGDGQHMQKEDDAGPSSDGEIEGGADLAAADAAPTDDVVPAEGKEEEKGEQQRRAPKRRRRRKGQLVLDEEHVETFYRGAIEPHAGYDKGYLLVPLDPATGAVDWPRVHALVDAPPPRLVVVGGDSLWPLPEDRTAVLDGMVLTQASEGSVCRLWSVEAVTEGTLGEAREAALAAAEAKEKERAEREEREREERERAEKEGEGEGEGEAMAVDAAEGEEMGKEEAGKEKDEKEEAASRYLKRTRLLRSSPPPEEHQHQRKKPRAEGDGNGVEKETAVAVTADEAAAVVPEQQQAQENGAEAKEGEQAAPEKKKEEDVPRLYLIEYPREVWDACDGAQPLLLVQKVLDSPHCFRAGAGAGLARGNSGAGAAGEEPRTKRQRSSNRRLLAPQVGALLPLPKLLYLACQRLLPRVWRLEIALAVERVVARVGIPLRNTGLVRAALCKPDYERLETIGDTYLKLVMGGVVLRKEPFLMRESLMHDFRANLICNRRLMQAARDRDLDGSIVLRKKVMNEPFRYWAPSLTRPGSASAGVVQGKVVADVVEALTGAYLVGEGPAAADAFLRWLGLPVLCSSRCCAPPSAEPSPVALAAADVLACPGALQAGGGPVDGYGEGKEDEEDEEGLSDGEKEEGKGADADADPAAAPAAATAAAVASPASTDKNKHAPEASASISPSPSAAASVAEAMEEDAIPSIMQPAASAPVLEEIHWPLQPKECHCWTAAALAHTPQSIFPKPVPAPAPDLEERIGKLEKLLRYSFRNKWLAFQALTHPSHSQKSRRSAQGGGHTVLVSDYQRFEFLGDALLDYMLIVQVAFEHPEWSPERLHNAKSLAVNNEHLAHCALHWLQLHRFLESDSIELNHCVERFAARALLPEGAPSPFDDEDGPETGAGGGWEKDSGPKALADMLEALIAAVYIDCHGDIARLAQVFLPFLHPRARRKTRATNAGGVGFVPRQWKRRNLQAEGLTPEDEAEIHALFPSLAGALATELGVGTVDPEVLKAPVLPPPSTTTKDKEGKAEADADAGADADVADWEAVDKAEKADADKGGNAGGGEKGQQGPEETDKAGNGGGVHENGVGQEAAVSAAMVVS